MTDDMDLRGVIGNLQHENERLRLQLFKLRTRSSWLERLNVGASVIEFVDDNYMYILMGIMLVALSFNLLETVKGLFHHSTKE